MFYFIDQCLVAKLPECAPLDKKRLNLAFFLIATFCYREFTYWLQSLSASHDQLASQRRQMEMTAASRLRPASPPSYRTGSGPPQVTISGVTGHIVQYNALSSPINERYVLLGTFRFRQTHATFLLRASRPWRSNSLTPPSSNSCLHLTAPEWAQQKGRSHSLTYVTDPEPSLSPASSTSTMDEREIEELIKNLPEGSGMRGDFFSTYLLMFDL